MDNSIVEGNIERRRPGCMPVRSSMGDQTIPGMARRTERIEGEVPRCAPKKISWTTKSRLEHQEAHEEKAKG